MKTKRSESLVRGRRAAKNVKLIPDHKIDFSDIPELTDEQLRCARRVGRPTYGDKPKQLIAIRIEPKLLSKLKKMASYKKIAYQTFIHKILEAYI